MNRTAAVAFTAAILFSPPYAGAAGTQDGTMKGPTHGAPMHGDMHGMAGGWDLPGASLDAVNLTTAQRATIDAIHRELRTKQTALMERMHATMHETHAYRDGKYDEAALRSAYGEAEKIHRQMFESRLEAQRRIDALLTPQQRLQLSQTGR